jgi:hypothetical protein
VRGARAKPPFRVGDGGGVHCWEFHRWEAALLPLLAIILVVSGVKVWRHR